MVATLGRGPHGKAAMIGRLLAMLFVILFQSSVRTSTARGQGVDPIASSAGTIPKEEAIWALRMVSGMTWGDEPGRWRDWYKGLPDDCRNASELIDGALSA